MLDDPIFDEASRRRDQALADAKRWDVFVEMYTEIVLSRPTPTAPGSAALPEAIPFEPITALGATSLEIETVQTQTSPTRLRHVILGTTGTCNASCIHCPTGKTATAHAPRNPMPMALFKKIVDGIAELELPLDDHVSFGLFGDGLVDPHVVERAAYLMSRLPYARLTVNTNGAGFSAKKHEDLNEYVFNITLHCESLIPEAYNELMRPLRAERVFPKFEQILDAFPGKVLVSVPISRRNLAEGPAIRQWFLDRGASGVEFDALSSRCAEDRTLFDSLAINPGPIRCPPVIMDDLIVDCDGQVLICCQDFQRAEGIGNLRTESLAEVLVGLRRANIRNLLAENRHTELSTCRRCHADDKIEIMALASRGA
jgi:hypothetical protein